MHKEFSTLDRVYYLLAGPRLAEAHYSRTTVPCTGADRSTPKPLTGSNLLHSQYQGDEQYKNVRNKPLDKTWLTKIASMLAIPSRDYYPLADPRLEEAHDYGTADRSAPKALANPNTLCTQHPSDNQHRDVEDEAHAKTWPAQYVVTEGHPLNGLPKGRYEDEGAGRWGT